MTTGYETQPNPAWPPPPTPVAAAPPASGRPGWVTTAAVLLLVVGALSALGGMLMLILGLVLGSEWTELMALESGDAAVAPEAVAGMMTGVLVVIAILALAWASGHVAAGVGILGGRGWARITGMVLSVIGLVFSVVLLLLTVASFGMTAAMMEDPEFRDLYGPGYSADLMGTSMVTSLLFVLPWLIGYIVVLVVLIRNGAFFNRPRAAVPQPTT